MNDNHVQDRFMATGNLFYFLMHVCSENVETDRPDKTLLVPTGPRFYS